MFLYPTLTIGFLFVAVPLLVHLINMLRHRQQPWAAMDFLLASYRKQKKWIRLRQLLLLLARLAVAVLLIALLAGWTGGRRVLGILGGQTTHHVVVLDDSYSMGDQSLQRSAGPVLEGAQMDPHAYARALAVLQDLTRRLASDEQNHQLTVLRASRAAMAMRGGSESGDAAADIAAQTITSDTSIINRVMGTNASPLSTDLEAALELAADLLEATPADVKYLYVASDFRARDWNATERYATALQGVADEVAIRMIDCSAEPQQNLAVTHIAPQPDVWVAGVPVVVNATVRNYGTTTANNVTLNLRVIRYSDRARVADPTRAVSGQTEPLPPLVIESLAPGAEITKSFQVYIAETGTHVVQAALPDDALEIDNTRSCTLPLSDTEKVLVVDGDPEGRGAFHVSSVLNPGSQVRLGAVPEVQPPSFLRSVTPEGLAAYRAIYLVDLPELTDTAAGALSQYVQRGGGVAWFLGSRVDREAYNAQLLGSDRQLLPAPLAEARELPPSDDPQPEVQFDDNSSLMAPLRAGGDRALALVGVSRSWTLGSIDDDQAVPVRALLRRRDGEPLVTRHQFGGGRVITVLTGLDGSWTNWPGDPTFVVFLLQANADLWSAAAAPTSRFVDDPLARTLSQQRYASNLLFFPPAEQPPRVPIELTAIAEPGSSDPLFRIELNPSEMAIEDERNVSELLRPGVAEWMLTRSDGQTEVIPVASVLRVGEGDLQRADQALIAQQLLPIEVSFLSSAQWSEETQSAGSSTLMLVLLGLLAAMLAAEQILAYWASYHVTTGNGRQDRSALAHVGGRR